MEPGLHGRGNSRKLALRALTRSSRNGARPSRPGKPGVSPQPMNAPAGRNGARPSRPGKHHLTPSRVLSVPGPQWSPAFTAGETSRYRPRLLTSDTPQWSPAFTAGETRVGRDDTAHQVVAAMEPGLHGRGNRIHRTTGTAPQCGRNGARPSRPGKPRFSAPASSPFLMPQWSPAFTAGET